MSALLEEVAYVPRPILVDTQCLQNGFSADPNSEIYSLFLENIAFDTREVLETDPTKKQLIPYCVVIHGDKIWTMRRKKKQTESRLHNKQSFGVGGHIPVELAQSGDIIKAGLLKELHEELFIEKPFKLSYQGTLNDDSNDVGQVHLGLVYTCQVSHTNVAIREVDKMDGEWLTLAELAAAPELETWSAFLMDHLKGWIDSI